MRKKVCRSCKIFVEGKECPLCKGTQFTTTWRGRLNILDANKSDIAKKVEIKVKGEYGIRVR